LAPKGFPKNNKFDDAPMKGKGGDKGGGE